MSILLLLFTVNLFSSTVITNSGNAFATRGISTRLVIRTPNNNLVLFYWNTGIKYAISTDKGVTWSAEKVFTTTTYGNPFNLEVVCDSSNNLYVNYIEGGYGAHQLKFCKMTWDGANYTKETPYYFSSEPDGSAYPQFWTNCMTKDKDGRFWMAYRTYDNPGKGLVVRSSSDGLTWDYNFPVAASTTLSAALDTTSTSVSLTSVTNFGSNGFIRIGSEWISYLGVSGTVLTGCGRGRFPAFAKLNAQINSSATTITVNVDLNGTLLSIAKTDFTGSGTIKIDGEWISYSGISGGAFTGCTRGTYVRNTTLSGDINDATTTTIITASGDVLAAGFASSGLIKIDSEWISYTGLGASNTQFTGCTRQAVGSTIASHISGVTISQGEASQHNINSYVFQAPLEHSSGAGVLKPIPTGTYTQMTLVKWNDYPAVFYTDGSTYYWRYFNGSSWQTPTAPSWWSANTGFSYGVSGSYDLSVAVTDDNYIHCAVWQPKSGVRIATHDNNAASAWSSFVTLQPNDDLDVGITPSITTNGEDLWCFWNKYLAANSYNIVYKKANKSGSSWTWDAVETNITSDGLKNVGVETLGGSNKAGTIPVFWTTGTSPYTIQTAAVPTSLKLTTVTPLQFQELKTATLSIAGAGFFGAAMSNSVTGVTIGSSAITNYTVTNDCEIYPVILPVTITVGSYDVIVGVTGGLSVTSSSKIVFKPGPTVTNLNPSTGLNISETTITITGSGYFAEGATGAITSIKLDDLVSTSITGYTAVSDSEINTAIVPQGVKPGTYNVKVTTTNGVNSTSTVKFTATGVPPTITNVAPVSASNLTPATLSIIGTSFFAGTLTTEVISVILNDSQYTTLNLSALTVISNTMLAGAVLPAGVKAGSYDILMTTLGGANSSSAQKLGITTSAPTVSSVSPAVGNNVFPSTVTITGSGFFGGYTTTTVSTIRLSDGAVTLLNISNAVFSDTEIAGAVIPPGVLAGSYDVKVTTDGGESTEAVKYQVKPAPVVTSITPSSISNLVITTLTIIGEGYFGGGAGSNVSSVKLDDAAATMLTLTAAAIDDTSITGAVLPAGVVAGTYNI